jgi:methionyl-tRNA synthetase
LTAPWLLTENKARLEQVLNILLNGIYAVNTFLSIVIPNKTEEVFAQLGNIEKDIKLINKWNKFDKVKTVKKGILFSRLK